MSSFRSSSLRSHPSSDSRNRVSTKLGGPSPFTEDFLAHVKFSPENTGLERHICGPVEVLGWPKSLGFSNELFAQPTTCPHWRNQPVDQQWL